MTGNYTCGDDENAVVFGSRLASMTEMVRRALHAGRSTGCAPWREVAFFNYYDADVFANLNIDGFIVLFQRGLTVHRLRWITQSCPLI